MIFLKLGGSLITQKDQPQTPRLEVLSQLAQEIADVIHANPGFRLLLGHGSGSFGHLLAARYKTHQGASSEEDWHGFARVWAAANQLNRLVVDALLEQNVPILSLPPSASAISERGSIQEMATDPILYALKAGLVPLVQGDVAFDLAQGSSILSTEEVFSYLAPGLRPSLILLAGIEAGVYKDFSRTEEIIPVITEENVHEIEFSSTAGTDVTGGMEGKVNQALSICRSVKGLEIRIFSGEEKGAVANALAGAPVGTLIKPSLGPG
jgi:isopentenyl phosphate kinase